MMRTTLNISDDVLRAAKALARAQKTSVGKVLSRLAREALEQRSSARVEDSGEAFYGFRPLKSRGTPVSDELIEQLRDEEGV